MSDRYGTSVTPYVPAPDTAGVLGGRMGAWFIDVCVIGLLWAIFSVALFVLGFLTFGLTWMLLAPLFPIIAVIYSGLTVSGRHRGTIGMRVFGVEMRTMSGQTAPFIVAAVHAVFFYVSISTLTPLVLLFGLFRDDRRLLHDILAGLIAVRR
jgi:uncharacterized RDD family membrane protein YckC